VISFDWTRSSPVAIASIIAANLVPIVGVVWLGCSVLTMLTVYWLEIGVVGAFNVLKMRRAGVPDRPPSGAAGGNRDRIRSVSGPALIPFFIVHYGLFWLADGLIIFNVPLFRGTGAALADVGLAPSVSSIAWTVLALTVSHGVAYRLDYVGRKEYLQTSAATQMFAPYGRLWVMTVTIAASAAAIAAVGSPVGLIIVLVVLKTILDVGSHLAERGRYPSPG